jgi:F-type H+-transporting ATPase subunit c
MSIGTGLVAIGAGFAVFNGFLTAIGQGLACVKAVEMVGRNPEAETKIRSMLILGDAIAETCAIYGMLIAFLIIFVLK